MTPQENTPSPDIPHIDPKDMATYMLVMESRVAATMEDLAVAHRVAKALEHPAVREEWKAMLQLEDPVLHPEKYPSAN
ncbi:MAG: hypothetical protein PHX87_04420 [Candidatus Peribacteraceae bacterium]|nr:hypothetical protein [Candidatus Peribacteraceae bacterium]MDD5742643.1 hypothetical protein [Candidatus Peribacteraceae bacterium]